MFDMELKRYEVLNELAECGGIVIFGAAEDVKIPIGELKQAFAIEENIYNRSMNGLSVVDAKTIYDACVAPIAPETLLLHIGENDIQSFKENAGEFVRRYTQFITHIKSVNETCRIVIVSLRNYENDDVVKELNLQLKYIADSQRCEFADIANPRVWNPKSTMETVSFVYSLGFVRSLKNERPVYNLVKILFMSVI